MQTPDRAAVDHVTLQMDCNPPNMLCKHCGATHTMQLPLSIDACVRKLEAFIELHDDCPAPPAGVDPLTNQNAFQEGVRHGLHRQVTVETAKAKKEGFDAAIKEISSMLNPVIQSARYATAYYAELLELNSPMRELSQSLEKIKDWNAQ